MASSTPAHRLFVRDQLTWLGYLMIGMYVFVSAAFGPIMPYFRSELHLSYTVAAYHFSALSLGSLIAGTIGDKSMRLLGRGKTIWLGGLGVIIGACIVVLGTTPVVTIFGAWLAGFCGSQMGQTINSIMADRFKEERAIGITEANIVAAIFSAVAPILVSLIVRGGLSWRLTIAVPAAIYGLLAVTNRNTIQATGMQSATRQATEGALPPAYWAYFVVIFLSCASEWSIVFWAPEFMEHAAHVVRADAACSVSVFLTAMFIGRLIGRRLARSINTAVLLGVAGCGAAIGFLVFWLGPIPQINYLGLFLVGLAEGNVYPFSLSNAIGAASNQTARATARMSISSGGAILSAPLVLGILADHTGIANAYGLIAVLLLMAAAMIFVANTLAQQQLRLAVAPQIEV